MNDGTPDLSSFPTRQRENSFEAFEVGQVFEHHWGKTVTADEIALARQAVDAVRAAEEAGAGAASLGGTMIDAATARIFQVTLDRAAQIDERASQGT